MSLPANTTMGDPNIHIVLCEFLRFDIRIDKTLLLDTITAQANPSLERVIRRHLRLAHCFLAILVGPVVLGAIDVILAEYETISECSQPLERASRSI